MGRKYRKKNSFLKILVLILIIVIGFFNQEEIVNYGDKFSDYVDYNYKSNDVKLGESENLSTEIIVYFCPKDDCYGLMYESFVNAKSEIKCALYEFDHVLLSRALAIKKDEGLDVKILIDSDYKDEDGISAIVDTDVEIFNDGERSKFMHNKFCVIDDSIVLTGSMNPTENGMFFNNNNLLKISSSKLAINYENEFDQMISGKFGGNKKSILEYNSLNLNYGDEEYIVSNYFCPKDDCAGEIVKILETSKEEILFASFVLTENDIEEVLISKDLEGVNVTGVIESRMWKSQGSIAEDLSTKFKVVKDTNPKTMHHKVFVVDSKYVITGSMNPTASGNKYNDENILIIENSKIANLYKEEIISLING